MRMKMMRKRDRLENTPVRRVQVKLAKYGLKVYNADVKELNYVKSHYALIDRETPNR
jgi:hypothetical protein